MESKAVGQSGDDNAMGAKKIEKVRAHTDTHTYISYDMMEFMKCLSYGLSYGLMGLMVLWISDVFSGIPLKANADDAGESLKDIRKLINNAHSRAYNAAIKEAVQRGESQARHFSIFEFFVFSGLKFSCCSWLS